VSADERGLMAVMVMLVRVCGPRFMWLPTVLGSSLAA
jgi:hypothetical protein